ncbi:hypothetical protein HDU96_004399 [Phlyctochytrium bullatum]|nr:hypothetical protein HDU96_004399 [Phlyctochytrium bullatum]
MGQSVSKGPKLQPLLQSRGLADSASSGAEDKSKETVSSQRKKAPIINLETNSEFETAGYSEGGSSNVDVTFQSTPAAAFKGQPGGSEGKLDVASMNISATSSETALKEAEQVKGSRHSLSPTSVRGILQNGSEVRKDRRVSIMVEDDEASPSRLEETRSSVNMGASSNHMGMHHGRRRSRLVAPDPYSDDTSRPTSKSGSRSIMTRSSTQTTKSGGAGAHTTGNSWGGGSRRASLWSTTTTSNKTDAASVTRSRPGTVKSRKPKSIQFSMGSMSSVQGSQSQLSQSTSSMPAEEESTLNGSSSQLVAARPRPSRKGSMATSGSLNMMDTLTIAHGSSGDISAIVEEEDTPTETGKQADGDRANPEATDNAHPTPDAHLADGHQQSFKWKSRKKRDKDDTPGRFRRGSNASQYSDASGGRADGSGAVARLDSAMERAHAGRGMDPKESQRSIDQLASRDSIAVSRKKARAMSTKTAASSFVGSQVLHSEGLDRAAGKRHHHRKESVWSERTKRLMISNRKMSMELEEMKYASLLASLPRVTSVWELEPI